MDGSELQTLQPRYRGEAMTQLRAFWWLYFFSFLLKDQIVYECSIQVCTFFILRMFLEFPINEMQRVLTSRFYLKKKEKRIVA